MARACVSRECPLVLGKDDEGRMTRDERLRLKQSFNPASGSRQCSYELYATHTYGAVGSPALWFRLLLKIAVLGAHGRKDGCALCVAETAAQSWLAAAAG